MKLAVHPHRGRKTVSRREADRQLAAREAQLRFYFEQSPEGIWRLDLERPLPVATPEAEQIEHLYRYAQVAECNLAMARMLGFERPDDILGARLADLLPREEPRSRHLPAFIRSGYRLAEAESHEVDREGRPRFFVHTMIGRVENGQLESAWGTQTDVTERRLLEEELRQGSAELLAADRHKDEFLAILAHELRNPLAPIRNAVEVMRGAGLPDPALRQAREIVDRQVRQLARLVDDLLDVSRIRRGIMELRREWVDLSAVLAGAVEASRPLIERRGHRLLVTAPPGPLWLEADPVRLEQVIANLLNNAAKYTPPGGQIWLEVEAAGPQVALTVRDTGIGFPHGVESRFFEPFVQGELPADAQGGLGIGLALVRGLVELHGGGVAARSPGPGLGSEFVVRLPAPDPALAPALPLSSEEADSAPERPLAVLIVEDDRDTAHSLATLVELWGHRPRTAADGLAGLAAAEPSPDVALLDLGLPGMDGCTLARELRLRLGPDLLLVALTGYGQEEDRRRTREAGFDHHFVKPVAPQTLRHLLADRSKQRPSG
ncbi:MAG: hypothetical protein QOJ16_953 [Acidobacteriota bacterium]|jgi:signal transduction histidine kinase/ActR/RegA family two-component response regulator|nr:hypothetical protein [Acidobacteriota bacterium]